MTSPACALTSTSRWRRSAGWPDIIGRGAEDLERFEEAYLGEWDSLAAYADQLFADLGYDELLTGCIPAGMQPYVQFDAEGFGRDLTLAAVSVTPRRLAAACGSSTIGCKGCCGINTDLMRMRICQRTM